MSRDAGNWLLLIHQLPPKPDYLRVKVWRRLQALGAIAIKNSVYALPANEQTREDFQWLQKEVEGLGGEATVCEARFVDGLSDEQLQVLFKAARDSDYAQLAAEARELLEQPAPPERREELRARQRRLHKRLAQVVALDFFAAEGRAAVESLLAQLDLQLAEVPPHLADPAQALREEYRGRVWVTRRSIRVDRMACAWLIRRAIDPQARFRFVDEDHYRHAAGELRFDMAAAEFTHEGDSCSFETLLLRFGLDEPALLALGQIIHDLDLKDGKYRRDEAAGVATLLAGIATASASDEERLERSAVVFDALRAGLAP
ncbi:MAG TPA: chromate resistance protein ChrB domain-containing protein [Solimonas sp.]|nr:chromate resistance protein ChrB domain-containing protein [Solimonas sp.]